MSKKSLIITIFILSIALIMTGCPKKTVVKEEPTVKKEEASKAEAERMAKKDLKKVLLRRKPLALKGRFLKALCSRIFTSTSTNTTSVPEMWPF